jgi:hypothetical protein
MANPQGDSLGMYFQDIYNLTVEGNTLLNLSMKTIGGACMDVKYNKTTINLPTMQDSAVQFGGCALEQNIPYPSNAVNFASNMVTSQCRNPNMTHLYLFAGTGQVVNDFKSVGLSCPRRCPIECPEDPDCGCCGNDEAGQRLVGIDTHVRLGPSNESGQSPSPGSRLISPTMQNSMLLGTASHGINSCSETGQIVNPSVANNSISEAVNGLTFGQNTYLSQADNNYISMCQTAVTAGYPSGGSSSGDLISGGSPDVNQPPPIDEAALFRYTYMLGCQNAYDLGPGFVVAYHGSISSGGTAGGNISDLASRNTTMINPGPNTFSKGVQSFFLSGESP